MKILSVVMVCALLMSFKPRTQDWLLVIHADGAKLTASTLELVNVGPFGVGFTAEGSGHREAVSLITKDFLTHWNDIFATRPPNAALSFMGKGGNLQEQVLLLESATLVGNNVRFKIQQMGEEQSGGEFGVVNLFIDGSKYVCGGTNRFLPVCGGPG